MTVDVLVLPAHSERTIEAAGLNVPAPANPGFPGPGNAAVQALPTAVQFLWFEGNRWHLAPPFEVLDLRSALNLARKALDETMDQVEGNNSAGLKIALVDPMSGLFDSIVPPGIRKVLGDALAANAGTSAPLLRIHLDSDFDIIPWELLHDGNDFLGLRYRIARVPMVGGGPAAPNGTPRKIRRIVTALGKDVLDDPLRKKWQQTFDGIVPKKFDVWRRPQEDDWPSLLALSTAGGDLLHVTCHGLVGEDGVFWSLDHTSPADRTLNLWPGTARTLKVSESQPLVFGNACQSAGAGTGVGIISGGFGWKFFDFGATAFVGTFAPISKKIAVEFAGRFFKRLLKDKKPLAEALWSTKKSFDAEAEADPSWLFYSLYGDPDTTFELAKS
jgi:hypothetical protein